MVETMDIKKYFMKCNIFCMKFQIFLSYLIFSVGMITAFWLYDELRGIHWQVVSALCISLGGVIFGIFAYLDRAERKREKKRKQLIELSENILKKHMSK